MIDLILTYRSLMTTWDPSPPPDPGPVSIKSRLIRLALGIEAEYLKRCLRLRKSPGLNSRLGLLGDVKHYGVQER